MTRIYGYPGDGINGLMGALDRAERPDLIAVRRALTFFTPEAVLLFQAVMLLLLLSVAIAAAAAGDPVAVAGLGVTPILLAAGYVVAVSGSRESATHPRWRALNAPEEKATEQREQQAPLGHMPTRGLATYSTLSALVILAAGWCLAQTGDALAQQTGLGGSFVGATLVASSTSLPELSTALAAVRQRNHQMAVSKSLARTASRWRSSLSLTRSIVAGRFSPPPMPPRCSPLPGA